jgi:hypothetical protein
MRPPEEGAADMASIDRLTNGKYRARYREVPGGPQRTRSLTRKADARAWLTEVEHQLLTGAHTYTPRSAGQITLADYAAEYASRRHWRQQTAERKERELRSTSSRSSAPCPWPA